MSKEKKEHTKKKNYGILHGSFGVWSKGGWIEFYKASHVQAINITKAQWRQQQSILSRIDNVSQRMGEKKLNNNNIQNSQCETNNL